MAIGDTLNLTGYKLTFDDEFNSFSSNGPANYLITGGTGTWDTTGSYGERHLNDEQEFYSDPTVGVNPDSVSGGVLRIHAAPSADPSQTWGLPYTSGIITTDHSFNQEYGYFEMRAELPQGAGMWPAFWLLPQVHAWPPELDPLEAFGQTNNGQGGSNAFHTGLVTNDPSISNQDQWNDTSGANLYTQYNTFGVQWGPNTITFYFDGKAYYTVPTPSDFHQSMYMLANLAVGGNWPGNATGESGDLKIDYIRAFSNNGANPAIVQSAISSPDGGGKTFYGATDAKGNAAGVVGTVPPAPPAPPAPPPPPVIVTGAGTDTLVISVSEDAYQGDAQYTVSVDGTRVGGTYTATASHANNATQKLALSGNWGTGAHQIAVSFINDAYGGTDTTDRNLYVDNVTYDSISAMPATASLTSNGTANFISSAPTIIVPASDKLVVSISEDAWQGDAQYTISIDGTEIGGTRTATASHAAGASQSVALTGNWGTGAHSVAVSFLNDAFGGTTTTDRNLYVNSMSYDGVSDKPASAALMSNGTATFTTPAPTTGAVTLLVSEDAYQGNANMNVTVDGVVANQNVSVTASHAAGASQSVKLLNALAAGTHDIGISFTNDLYAGTANTDRNLYLNGIQVNNTVATGSTASFFSNGTDHFSIIVPQI